MKKIALKLIIPLMITVASLGAMATGQTVATSPFGAEDRIGAINHIDQGTVKNAMSLVKKGKVYSLAVVTAKNTPSFGDRQYGIEVSHTGPIPLGANKMTALDDKIITSVGVGTQIDGLGHLGINDIHYNNVPRNSFMKGDGLTTFGTHDIPPIVTRGIMLDIAALNNVTQLQAGYKITVEDLKAALIRQSLTVQRADVVLLHTGWLSMAETDGKAFVAGEPGLTVAGATWLAAQKVVAVGADNSALEVIPFEVPDRIFEVHQTLLAKNGVYILENIKTTELARDKVYSFAFILAAPRFYGAVQMVSHPIAIN